MATFLQQLRLLLWKNCLSVVRQPVWSLVLLIWPLVIFIILAVTRSQFPPVQKSTCYAAPRNLPSAGFFPFLQTLLCNSDSVCANKSYLLGSRSAALRSLSWSSEDASRLASIPFGPSLLDKMSTGLLRSAIPAGGTDDQLMQSVRNLVLNTKTEDLSNVSLIINKLNETILMQQAVSETLSSADFLKRLICNHTLPLLFPSGDSSSSPLSYGLLTFCQSKDTLLEAAIVTLNHVLSDLALKNPGEMLLIVGEVLGGFETLQGEAPLWDFLLGLPQLFQPEQSPEQSLSRVVALLGSITRVLDRIQKDFLQANPVLSYANHTLGQTISILQYVLNWPGKGDSISLKDVVTKSSGSEETLIENVRVPLDKALVLADNSSFNSFICGTVNGLGSPMAGQFDSLCASGGTQAVFSRIAQRKVAEQVFLAWTRAASRSDVDFTFQTAGNLLRAYLPDNQEVVGNLSTVGQLLNSWITVVNDSILLSLNQTTGENLFVDLGSAALGTARELPGWPSVHRALMGSLATLQLSTQLLDTQADILGRMEAVLIELQKMIHSLMSNQSFSDVWVGTILNSTTESILKVILSGEQWACHDFVTSWSWYFTQHPLGQQDWAASLCSLNGSQLLSSLQLQVEPLIDRVYLLLSVINGSQSFEVTASQLLSEWQSLRRSYLHYAEVVGRVSLTLGADYWAGWNLTFSNSSVDWAGIITNRSLQVVAEMGTELEQSPVWPTVLPYFQAASWIMAYQPNGTGAPNCSQSSFLLLEGSAVFLQSSFQNYATDLLREYLRQQSLGQNTTSEVYKNLLGRVLRLLEMYNQVLANITSLDQVNSSLSLALIHNLLETFSLKPLEAIWLEGHSNISTIIGSILQAAENNQHLLSGLMVELLNDSMQSVKELDALIEKWLSREDSLLHSLSFGMGKILLRYSYILNLTDLASLHHLLQPFIQTNLNTSSTGEFLLNIFHVVKQVIEAPYDLQVLVEGYLRQLQNLLTSALYMNSGILILSPDVQIESNVSVLLSSDLKKLAQHILPLLYAESLQNFSNSDSLKTILQHFTELLPGTVKEQYEQLIKVVTSCTESHIFNDTHQNISGLANFVLKISEFFKNEAQSRNIQQVLVEGYLRQLQTFLISALNMKTELLILGPYVQLEGNISVLLSSDLKQLALRVLPLLSPESLQKLNNSSDSLMSFFQSFTVLLPGTVKEQYEELIKVVTSCTESQLNCSVLLNETSHILAEVAKALEEVNNGSLSILLRQAIHVNNSFFSFDQQGNLSLIFTAELISMLLPWDNSTNMSCAQTTIIQTLTFLNQIATSSNFSLTSLQQTLESSNFNITELNTIVQLLGASNVSELVSKLNKIVSIQECYNLTSNSSLHCTLKLIYNVFDFLVAKPMPKEIKDTFWTVRYILEIWIKELDKEGVLAKKLEALHSFTSLLLQEGLEVNWIRHTSQSIVNTLKIIKINLQKLSIEYPGDFNTGIQLLDELNQLFMNGTYPYFEMNSTNYSNQSMENVTLYLEIIEWYLKKVEDITLSRRNISERLYPFFKMTELTLSESFSNIQFTSSIISAFNKTKGLVESIQLPLDESDLRSVIKVVVEAVLPQLQLLTDQIDSNLDFLGNIAQYMGQEMLNSTLVDKVADFVKIIRSFSNVTDLWLENSPFTSAISHLLFKNETSFSLLSQLTNLENIVRAVEPLLSAEQRAHLNIILEVSQMVKNLASETGSAGKFNSTDISRAILDLANVLVNISSVFTGPVPESVVRDVMDVLQGSMLLASPSSELDIDQARNLSIEVIGKVENLVRALAPQSVSSVLLHMTQAVRIYLETISHADPSDVWNQIILNEFWHFLSFNNTGELDLSFIQNIPGIFLDHSKGNTVFKWRGDYMLDMNMSTVITIIERVLISHISSENGSRLLQAVFPALSSLFPHGETWTSSLNESLLPVLLDIITGADHQDSWETLGQFLNYTLSILRDTPAWGRVQAFFSAHMDIVKLLIRIFCAETELHDSLKEALVNLTCEVRQAMGSAGANDTGWAGSVLQAVLDTSDIIRQAGLTAPGVSCADIARGNISKALGISDSRVELWCNRSLGVVSEKVLSVSSGISQLLNRTKVGMIVVKDVNITAAELVKTLQTLFSSAQNYSLSVRQLYRDLTEDLLGYGATNNASNKEELKRLSASHVTLAVSSILKPLLNNTAAVPGMRVYLDALEWIVNYIIQNSSTWEQNCTSLHGNMRAFSKIWSSNGTQFEDALLRAIVTNPDFTTMLLEGTWKYIVQNNSAFTAEGQVEFGIQFDGKEVEPFVTATLNLLLEDDTVSSQLLAEVLQTLLHYVGTKWNISLLNQAWEAAVFNASLDGRYANNFLKDAIREMIRLEVVENGSLAFSILDNFLDANGTELMFVRMFELASWWKTTDSSGMTFVVQALQWLCRITKAVLSAITDMGFNLPSGYELFVDLSVDALESCTGFAQFNTSGSSNFSKVISTIISYIKDHQTLWKSQQGKSQEIMEELVLNYLSLLGGLSTPSNVNDVIMSIQRLLRDNSLISVLDYVFVNMTGDPNQNNPIKTMLNLLLYMTRSGPWEKYTEIFSQVSQQDPAKLKEILKSLSNLTDLINAFLKQPPEDYAQRLGQTFQELSAVIVNITKNKLENSTDFFVTILSTMNGLLHQNMNISNEIKVYIHMSEILQELLNSQALQSSQNGVSAYLKALDQTLAVFSSFLSPEQNTYLNLSVQMIRGFVHLVYAPNNLEDVVNSTKMIATSLDLLLVNVGNVTFPTGQTVKEVLNPLITDPVVITHLLWNLSVSTHNLTNASDKLKSAERLVRGLVLYLPEEQRFYINETLLRVLSTPNISNATEITKNFFTILRTVTDSLKAVLNFTDFPVSKETSAGNLVKGLLNVSELLSSNLWRSLEYNSSLQIVTLLSPLQQMVNILSPLLPPEEIHYLNASVQILEMLATFLNKTTNSSTILATSFAISDSLQKILGVKSDPASQSVGSTFNDLRDTLQRILQVYSSNDDDLSKTANITMLIVGELQSILRLANSSYEMNEIKQVLEVIKANADSLRKINSTNWVDELLQVLVDTVVLVPSELPHAPLIKNLTKNLAENIQGNLTVLSEAQQALSAVLLTNWETHNISEALKNLETKTVAVQRLRSSVCDLEKLSSGQLLNDLSPFSPGSMCRTGLPVLHAVLSLFHSLLNSSFNHPTNLSAMPENLYNILIGDPSTYDVNTNWISSIIGDLGINTSSLGFLNISTAPLGSVTVFNLFRNQTDFASELHNLTGVPLEVISDMLLTVVPNNSIHMLAWLTNLQYCSDPAQLGLNQSEELVFRTFCTFSPVQWYNFAVVVLHNLDLETVIYRVLMSSDMQNTVGVMMQLLKAFLGLMNKLLPQLQVLMQYLRSVQQLNLIANPEFRALSSGTRSFISSRATFATLSQAMCTNGMLALFGISEVPNVDESQPSTQGNLKREQLIDKFNIPRNATPFCMGLYLDMVNTTGGAVAWAFLKPMLLGKILYTPDTPETAAIMKKSNATLQQFADLKVYAEEWIKSSSYVQDAVQVLEKTLPILQNSLNNTFVQNFIRLQANIDVNEMKQTLQGLSNVSAQLQKNSNVLKQMTTLSQLMLNLSSCVSFDRFQALNSTAELNSLALDLTQTRDHYASVVFKLQKNPGRRKRSLDTGLPLPPLVAYTIRMSIENTMRTDRTRDLLWARDSYISPTRNQRHTRGFVYLQESIDRAIMELQTGRSVEEPAVQLQPFPYPCYNKDDYLQSISYAFPLVLMIAWVLFVANFVKKLVHERELRLHEYMKMMGVNPASHFFAWFLEGAAFLLITIIFLTIILKAGGILPSSDGFILFLYLCDYGLSILAISFLVSSFFDQTNIAGLSGSLIYVIFFFPFIVVMSLEQNLSFSTKTLLGLFSPTCFSYASQYIARYEEQGVGLQWNNSYTSPLSGDTSSFGWMCWLLLIDSLLYFIMGWYIRIVFPGKYGIAAPWYFPVLPSFWADRCGCGGRSPTQGRGLFFANVMRQNQGIFPKDKDGDVYVSEAESEFAGLPVGVALHGLTKTYGSRTAIRNLNLQFYEGQVTALLGHNGAGKTTTMSLLTGLFGPSSGSIVVYGKDMQTYIKEVRRDLGVCMQYDVHFDHLTAKEHLLLYGSIKAPHWSKAELYQQVKKTLQETGMYAHRHKRVGTLSGGMKRKLSISIAFIAGSRLVVLDEPTSGVDPCSRRSIWDIVIQNKTERTIILSTHHLDEAEVLSDRIAFLERGGLKCCGSPFFLKDKLGKGYSLTLTKKAETPGSDAGFNSEEVSAFIKSHLPEAWLKEGEVGDVVYSLPPFSSQNAEDYRSLLTSLDKNLDTLQLGCYGISDTTLEEVFLQLTGDEEEESRAWSRTKRVIDLAAESDGMPEETTSSSYTVSDKEALTGSASVEGLALIGQCVLAMLIKRLHHSRRNWKGLISQILLPVLFVIAAMGLGTIKSNLQDFPELRLSPALYPDGQQYAFFSNDNPSSSPLVNTMMSFPGIDNVCLENPASQYCLKDSQLGDWTRSGNMSLPNGICECTSTVQTCPRFNFEPPSKRNPSSQIVYNLTNVNIEKYLLLTANNFIQDRYGGWSFGASLPTDLRMDMVQKPQNRTLTKVWYNPEGYHTMPAFLNSLNNFILRTNLPSDVDPKKYGITVFSHPYPGQVQNDDVILRNLVNTLVALCILLGYSIMTASFVVYEVQEHHSGAKRLQHISGIGEPFYWIVNFFYDMTLYLFPVAVSVAVIAAFQLPAFNSQYNLGAVSLLLVLFGLATFPWMYLLAGTFKDTEMAFISYVCINLFIAVNTIISTSVVYFLMQINQVNGRGDPKDIQRVYDVLSSVFLIFPQFSFGNGLMELSRLQMEVEMLALYGVDAYKNPFRMDVLGWIFVSMAIQFVVFSALRLLLNTWLLRKIRSLLCRRSVPDLLERDEDEDVVAERHRVESQGASSDVLQVSQLNKVYQNLSKKVHAVRRLSVGIPAGECFGLLGVNGAGKTTTFKILTGEIMPTDGAVHIRDQSGRLVNVADSYNEGLKIGYCPQVDALDFLLTAEEHLYFYARIRGISSHHISRVVSHLLQKLELAPHKDVTSERYSCGMRRKLSTAIALIGRPQILLLDEPSSGMDPKSKRHLWKIISEEVKAKTAVVLTSHSMEECEAVCTRLAIMVKGQFKCLGSLQHIKSRFGSGFTVKMYLSVGMHDVDLITNFMQIHFPSTYMKDQHLGMVEYHVPVVSGGVADIFDKLETNKEALHIKHFSVSQTTLDEVFINFAMGKTNKRSSNGSETETTDPTVLVNI
nr:PREDICTED: ATP-binding cassette sub-family A member 12 [Lepisosteus oculatus]